MNKTISSSLMTAIEDAIGSHNVAVFTRGGEYVPGAHVAEYYGTGAGHPGYLCSLDTHHFDIDHIDENYAMADYVEERIDAAEKALTACQ